MVLVMFFTGILSKRQEESVVDLNLNCVRQSNPNTVDQKNNVFVLYLEQQNSLKQGLFIIIEKSGNTANASIFYSSLS